MDSGPHCFSLTEGVGCWGRFPPQKHTEWERLLCEYPAAQAIDDLARVGESEGGVAFQCGSPDSGGAEEGAKKDRRAEECECGVKSRPSVWL